MTDVDWMEGDAAGLLDKLTLAKTLSYAPKAIDKWVRNGCPVHGTKRALRFSLAEVVHWLVEDQGGGELDAVKLDSARANARLRQLEVEEREGKLVHVDEVTTLNADRLARLQTDLMAIPSRFTADIQQQVRDAILESINRLSE